MIEFIKRLLGIKSHDFAQMVEDGAVIVDVRTKAEYGQGKIKNAKNIPLNEIQHAIGKLKKEGKPVIAYCRSGNRSGMAVRMLNSAGVEAYNGGSIGSLSGKLG